MNMIYRECLDRLSFNLKLVKVNGLSEKAWFCKQFRGFYNFFYLHYFEIYFLLNFRFLYNFGNLMNLQKLLIHYYFQLIFILLKLFSNSSPQLENKVANFRIKTSLNFVEANIRYDLIINGVCLLMVRYIMDLLSILLLLCSFYHRKKFLVSSSRKQARALLLLYYTISCQIISDIIIIIIIILNYICSQFFHFSWNARLLKA